MTVEEFDPALIEALRVKIATKHEELRTEPAEIGLLPLAIQCVMASCKQGRHSLDHSRKSPHGVPTQPGTCRDCGQKIVELPEVGGRSYNDPNEILGLLHDSVTGGHAA